MKLQELLSLLDRILKDVAPRSSLYASSLREHISRTHKELLEEEIKIE